MSAWRSCGRWNFTSCMFLLSLNRIFQASERSSRKSRCRKTEQRRSGRRDVAQRSSGSLIEVTDDKMPVGLIDPSDPAILRQMRELMKTRHYAAHTERSWTGWASRFAQFARGWDNVASTVTSTLRLNRRVMNAVRSGGGRQRIGDWRAFSGGSEGRQRGARAGKPELRLRWAEWRQSAGVQYRHFNCLPVNGQRSGEPRLRFVGRLSACQ